MPPARSPRWSPVCRGATPFLGFAGIDDWVVHHDSRIFETLLSILSLNIYKIHSLQLCLGE